MATEAAASDHSATSEQSEKELKRTEPDKVVNLEPKEPGSAAASSAESVENVEDKKTEPPAADEVKEIKTYEEPKTEEPKSVAAASAESGAKIEEKKSEVPVAEEVEEKKFEPLEAKEVKGIKTGEKPKAEEPESLPATSDESGAKNEEKKTEPKAEDTKDIPITEGPKETVLESERTNYSEPSTECKSEEELPRKVDKLPAADIETIVPHDEKVSKNSDSTPFVEEKPVEQPEATELTAKEPKLVHPVKDVEIETGIDKVVETTRVVEISDQVESEDTPEIKVQVKDVEYSPSGEVLERTAETKAKIIEPSDADSAEKSDIADKSSGECEGDTEKAAGSEVISRSIDLAPEHEKKEETVASDETNKAAEVDDKAEKEATTTEAESKEADKTPFTESKSEEEKKDEEAVKANPQDSEETKRSQDVPKEDVPVKTQKQSNNIIKMMKHSLGKAKKAIIGKPQNSKAPAGSETRDETASK